MALSDELAGFGYMNELKEALRKIVVERLAMDAVSKSLNIPASDKTAFSVILGDSLGDLNERNCSEYGLSEKDTIAWMNDGRPAGSYPSAPEPDFSEDPGAVIPTRNTDRSL